MSVNKRRGLAASFGLAALLTVSLSGLLSPHPVPRYTVTDLGVLPGDSGSRATVLNSRGDAAGFTQGVHRRSCVFQNGMVTKVGGLPGESDSYALCINSQGEVTGDSGSLTSHHAFLYSGSKTRALGTLPGFKDSEGSGHQRPGRGRRHGFDQPRTDWPAPPTRLLLPGGQDDGYWDSTRLLRKPGHEHQRRRTGRR